ncbi:MAG: hypothetical protein L6Q37_03390, partial [Bdellovibrionaceae bacterium]|nr:hypothetical protein [Pseudobdellovibrionaceae bacterium]NUM59739.1 hypothetical protein [Pseudobdellovibrionaceae bacterium]
MFARLLPIIFLVIGMVLGGCSSAQKRQEERNKVAQSSGLYCEFVNGDANNDVDVEINLQMSKKCDISKQFTITNYKNASDIFGLVYCCHYQKGKAPAAPGAKASGNTDGLD